MILEEAAEVDAAEDEQFGDRRGDELPEQLRTGDGRQARPRDAKLGLEDQRAREARPVSRERPARLREAKRRQEEELWVEQRANAAYEAWRSEGSALTVLAGWAWFGAALRAAAHADWEDQPDRS